jgi:hypothetical protein
LKPIAGQPDPVLLGELEPGRIGRASLKVLNPGPGAIEVARFETSCPCMRVESDRSRIEANGAATLAATFDPSEERDFRGKLAIEYRGISPDGSIVIRGVVEVEVKSSQRQGGQP